MDYPQIRKALLEMDDGQLSVDDLKAISKQLPTAEEVSFFICTVAFYLKRYVDRAYQIF